MFVLKQACRAITRKPLNTLLTALIAILCVAGTTFTLALEQAHTTAHTTAYDSLQPAAVIRPTATLAKKYDGTNATWHADNAMNWGLYNGYAMMAQMSGAQFDAALTESFPVRASKTLQPVQTEASKANKAGQDENKTGGSFTLRAFSRQEAVNLNTFGSYRIVSGKNLDYEKPAKHAALISSSVAKENNLKAGDTFTVGDPSDSNTTYELKVAGIYEYTDNPSTTNGDKAKLTKDNRKNAIYVSYSTVVSEYKIERDNPTGWAIPDLDIAFLTNSPTAYENFKKVVESAKLKKGYEVSSPTIDEYNEKIAPLDSLYTRVHTAAPWVITVAILLVLGLSLAGVIRKRTAEFAYAIAVGRSRGALAGQLMLESLLVLVPSVIIGLLLGIFVTNPLAQHIASGNAVPVYAGTIWHMVGWSAGLVLVGMVVTGLRAVWINTHKLVEIK